MMAYTTWDDVGIWMLLLGPLLAVAAAITGIVLLLIWAFTKKKPNSLLLKGTLIVFTLGMLCFLVGMGICGWFSV